MRKFLLLCACAALFVAGCGDADDKAKKAVKDGVDKAAETAKDAVDKK